MNKHDVMRSLSFDEVWERCETIGDLAGHRGFRTGDIPCRREFLTKLWELLSKARALSTCPELCRQCGNGTDVLVCMHHGPDRMVLGFSYSVLYTARGEVFFVNDMVLHYVCSHMFYPGKRFVKAVLEDDSLQSSAYFSNIARLGITLNEPIALEVDSYLDAGVWPAEPMPVRIKNERLCIDS